MQDHIQNKVKCTDEAYLDKEKEYLSSMYWQLVKNSKNNKLTKQIFKDFLGISEYISYKIFKVFDKDGKRFLTLHEFLQAINTCFSISKACDGKDFRKMLFYLFNKSSKKNEEVGYSDIQIFLNYLILDIFNKLAIYDFKILSRFISSIFSFIIKIFNVNRDKLELFKIDLSHFINILSVKPEFELLMFFLLSQISPIKSYLIKKLVNNDYLVFQNDEFLIDNNDNNLEVEENETPRINLLNHSSPVQVNLTFFNSQFHKDIDHQASWKTFKENSSNSNLSTKEGTKEFQEQGQLNCPSPANRKFILPNNFAIYNTSRLDSEKDENFMLIKNPNFKNNKNYKTLDTTNYIMRFDKKNLIKLLSHYKPLEENIFFIFNRLKILKHENKLEYSLKNIYFSLDEIDLNLSKIFNDNNNYYYYNNNQIENYNKDENEEYILDINQQIIYKPYKNNKANFTSRSDTALHICDIELNSEFLIFNKSILINNTVKTACYFFQLQNIYFDDISDYFSPTKNLCKVNLNGNRRLFYVITFTHLNEKYRIYFEYFFELQNFYQQMLTFTSINYNLKGKERILFYYKNIFTHVLSEEVNKLDKIMFSLSNIPTNLGILNKKFKIFKKDALEDQHLRFFRKLFYFTKLNNFLDIPIFPIQHYYENKLFILLEFSDESKTKFTYDKLIQQFSLRFIDVGEPDINLIRDNVKKFRKIIVFLNEKKFLKHFLELLECGNI